MKSIETETKKTIPYQDNKTFLFVIKGDKHLFKVLLPQTPLWFPVLKGLMTLKSSYDISNII